MKDYAHIDADDLHRVRALIMRDHPVKSVRAAATADVAELAEWTLTHGRWPQFSWTGTRIEQILAIRLHAYAVRLATADGIQLPKNPLIAAETDGRRAAYFKALRARRGTKPMREPTKPTPVETELTIDPWDVDQSHWPDGAA